jgi:cob(I)alamin adenosyltransferase
MGNSTIIVSQGALDKLKNAIATAGKDYKENYAKLTALMDEITNGDIQGDLATELMNKFSARKEDFEKIQKMIDDAEDYMGMKGSQFNTTTSNIQSGTY